MTIKEIKFKWDGQGKALSAAEIDFLLSEINRLTAECQKWQEWHDCEYRERKKYRQDANHFAGEVQRLTAELKEREGEVERLQDEVRDACGYAHDMESLAASRLADQVAIERNVIKWVAGEILYVMGFCESFAELRNEITNRYGVE